LANNKIINLKLAEQHGFKLRSLHFLLERKTNKCYFCSWTI